MNDLNLVVSTRALAIKFPTPNGTGCIRGKQYSATCCYDEALKIGFKGKKVHMVSRGEARVINGKGVSHNLDPREVNCDRAANPTNELEDIVVSDIDVERCLKLDKGFPLEANLDVFI